MKTDFTVICGGCKKTLLSNEIIICKECELKADEIIKTENGNNPFGDTENFDMLMKYFVMTIAEYQATHRLDFRSTMAILNTFQTIAENANKEYMTLYGYTLKQNGVDSDGNDLQ